MNTLILEPSQFLENDQASLSERQREHIRKVLKLKVGDTLTVGELNGLLGRAELSENKGQLLLSNIRLNEPPPASLDFKLILAMPRPQMLKRILQTVAIFGMKELILIQSQRVEKSFWQSPSADDQAIREQLILGLEQAKATQLPTVQKFTRFRPFMEDNCPELTKGYEQLLAHPGDYALMPTNKRLNKISLAIGPEGGFTEHEVGMFQAGGFSTVQMGNRILKVETAVTAFLGRLY